MNNHVGKHSMNGRAPRKSVLSAAIFAGIALAGFGTAALAADDTSLTWNGITLYGTVDVGIAYQTHGSPLSQDFYPTLNYICLLYTSPSPRDRQKSRMPSSA